MTATTQAAQRFTDATTVRLNFAVIEEQVAKVLDIPREAVTDAIIGDLLGHDRSTIWRWRGGALPNLPAAIGMAQVLGLSVTEITAPLVGE